MRDELRSRQIAHSIGAQNAGQPGSVPECSSARHSGRHRGARRGTSRTHRGLDFNEAEPAPLNGIAIRDDGDRLDALDLVQELTLYSGDVSGRAVRQKGTRPTSFRRGTSPNRPRDDYGRSCDTTEPSWGISDTSSVGSDDPLRTRGMVDALASTD